MSTKITIKKLYEISDAYTDELQEVVGGIKFANQAIAKINTRVGLTLPFFQNEQEEYTALNANWLVTILVPYLNWGIKMNDGSLNEADRYLQDFSEALYEFDEVAIGAGELGAGGVVDVEFIDQERLEGMIVQIDFKALNKNSDFWW